MSPHPITLVAFNELSMMLKQPLVILITCLMFLFAALNGVASADQLPRFYDYIEQGRDPLLAVGISNTFYVSSLLLAILSFSIAILSVAEERSGGSIRVLITKPLYRRDYIAGKYLGLSLFIVLLVAVVVLINASMIMVFYGGPISISELALRLFFYTMVLSLYCIEMMGIAMLIGVFFKSLYQVLIISTTVLCFEKMFSVPVFLIKLQNTPLGDLLLFRPWLLLCKIISPGTGASSGAVLLDTVVPFSTWLSEALPYMVFLLALIVVLALAICYIFNSEEA
ncbi:ABC transporter permease [Methanocella conradii]|uniref:ABC transporter permease n=1 Tax=Methanocella conradii TaxID=1175444 RepID=UPI00157CDACF|nr:ABC transporter permease subunit [Methanocella conradii]